MSYKRPAWLEDSELFFFEISVGYAALSAANQKALCGEVDSGLNLSGGYFSDTPPTHYAGVIFNQPMDIDKYYIGGRVQFGAVGAHYGGWRDVEYSTNTTNGEDGTWNTSEAIVNNDAEHTATGWRTPVTLGTPLNGVKAIRFGIRAAYDGGDLYMIHVYGAQTTGDRIEFWHPTLNQALTPDDMYFGKIVWGETGSLDFRIKNSSGSTLADNVVLSTDIVVDGSPSVLPDLEFSDGGAYATSLDIGDITAGSISSTITMRISPDTDDTPIMNLLFPAIAATPTSGPPKSAIYSSYRILDHYPYTAYDGRHYLPRNGVTGTLYYDASQVVPRTLTGTAYDAEQLVEVKPDIGIYNGAWHLPQTVYNNELSLGGLLSQTTLARLLNESWGSSSVPTAIDPIVQSSPALWLAADSLGLNDTDPVSTWADSSSNGRDATMSGATYDADGGPGGNPGVITPSQGTVPAFMSGAGEMVLVYTTAPSGTGSGFDDWGTHGFNSHYPYSNNDVYTDWGNNSRRDQIDTLSYSTGYLIGTHSATSDWAYYRDDLNPKYTASLTPSWSTNPHKIGVEGATISEYIVWDRKLSFSERAGIYKHLGTKYGLTIANLPNTTPAPSFPGVATPSARWDATAITGLNHGDTVSTWADLSGNGHDLDTVTNQTYHESGINGRPAVDFAGDDYMYLSGLNDLDLTGDFFVIAAVDFDVTGGGQRTIVGKSYERWELAETSATMVGYVGGASNPVYGGTLSANTPYVLAIRRTGGTTFSSRLDGTEMQSTTNSASSTGGTSLHVGVRPGGSYWMNGTIGEIIIYTSDISDTDRDLLETYMTTKWT